MNRHLCVCCCLLGGSGALQVCFCEKPDFITKCEDTDLHLFNNNADGNVGAWAASVLAPLDWGRHWQVYPIPDVMLTVRWVAYSHVLHMCGQCDGMYSRHYIYVTLRPLTTTKN
ncbi:uncharacterized protein LOC133837066 [Drosophila sulfurigaster albostrigata]|uniref:uncharacterized protein LOC133837066 n=1 Tax=Drosophila sulfurigaster albostrigata TaxID=89887 RepID=UPI002D21DBD8|nr:uncharacterized protein LOC133837066 [Drosophila sulfurigaster albostrigata]